MLSIKSLFVLGLLSLTAHTAPTSLHARQSNGATCGSNTYSADDVNAAIGTGCDLYQNSQTVGRNRYPHAENNYEQLAFLVDPPYLEFPILPSGDQFDGSTGPGPDRVVFDQNCALAGVVTHTGAGGNNFLLCDYN